MMNRFSRCNRHLVIDQLWSIIAVMFIFSSSLLMGEDWPRWMGPKGDNRWEAKGIVDRFPEGGPKTLWRAPVAGGYAGPAVVGDRVYVTDFVAKSDVKVGNFERKAFEGEERILCLNALDGKEIWKYSYPVSYGISYPAGPRCTPIIDGELLYTLGAEGNLICFEAKSGKIVWKKDLPKEYNTKSALWGYAAHPLIDGPRLICIVGGAGSHTVAFDKKSGKELWKSGTATEQGYTPPTIIEAAGVRQLIVASPDFVNGLNPETGSQLWTVPYEATNGSIIMTPIRFGEYLFVGGYSNHNLMMKLDSDKPGAKSLSKDKAKLFLSPVNVQPFLIDNVMYGMDQGGDLMAVELPSGKRLWTSTDVIGNRSAGSETAFFVAHEDRHFIFNEKGELLIGKISPEGLKVLDKASVIEPTNNAFGRPVVWCAPAFANGCMYVRNDAECVCIDLKAKK